MPPRARSWRSTPVLALLLVVAACSEEADPTGVLPPEMELPTAAGHLDATPVEYTVSWLGGSATVLPIQRALSVVDYYSYGDPFGASANTPDGLEASDTGQFFLYEDTGTGEMSLVVILDSPNDGSGGRLTLDLAGLPTDATWVVRDDPGDDTYAFSAPGETTVSWLLFPCCTDGGALGGSFHEPFTASFTFSGIDGLDAFVWRTEEGGGINTVAIPSAALNTLTLTAAPPNTPPEAVASAPSPVELDGAPAVDVTLDGTASSDDDEDALTYSWSKDGSEIATEATTVVSLGLGTHTFVLEVSDGQATDTDEVTVEVVDPSPPAVEATLTGTEGDNGWFTSTVEVAWTVTELESPSTLVLSGCDPATAGEGSSTFACSAESAGGTTTAEVTVLVDTGLPTITFSGNEGSYALTDVVAISCEATDDGSGIATADCPGASGEAWTFGIGTETLEATATDVAGNTATASTSFQVVGDADSVEDLLRAWIGNRGLANSLAAKLRAAERASERGNAKAAAGAIGAFENQVRALTGKWLTQEQADFLLALY